MNKESAWACPAERQIAESILMVLQRNVQSLIRAFMTATTNDQVRNLFGKYLKKELNCIHNTAKYFKLKNWASQPPKYPHKPPTTKEEINSGEAFHLWSHLCARYDQIELTKLYENYTHDPDFKFLLTNGLRMVLEDQLANLEQEMDHFGLPLPERPPKSIKTTQNAEVISDEMIYRNIMTGQQNMLRLHSSGLIQSITNDRIRNIYLDLIKEEIDILNKFIKYGKTKGWIRTVPNYNKNI
ncbi:Protein of unknown function (DUF3231) [Halobacteroides halobius DSM 5150]|uniref:Coat F domain-containing protein n=1 Tax=Halobacteroides halobius (strain ATCC 35273 / DSM 5150 / MD-1) TaxID=748449 RepID=L0KAD6_HALHC|nr:DUF3231 family protein [Halobacteroides halobius]AGB41505.1 Protein of unknown function (DUF3231) [Halobacteroides halobius DSM 5150]